MAISIRSLKHKLQQTSAVQEIKADIQVFVKEELLHVVIEAEWPESAQSPEDTSAATWLDWFKSEWRQASAEEGESFLLQLPKAVLQGKTKTDKAIIWERQLALPQDHKPRVPLDRDTLFHTLTPSVTTNLSDQLAEFASMADLTVPAAETTGAEVPDPRDPIPQTTTELFFQGLAQGIHKTPDPKSSPPDSAQQSSPDKIAADQKHDAAANNAEAKSARTQTIAFLVLGAILFGNAISQKISEIAAVSNFLNDVGAERMLLVWIVDGFLNIVITGFQSLIIDRFNRITLIQIISIGLALSFVLVRLLFLLGAPSGISYAALFLISQQQLVFFPLVFWILASDIFELSKSKRLFPRLAVWGLVGNLAGIELAAIMPPLLDRLGIDLQEILSFNALIYVFIAVILILGLDHKQITTYPQPKEKILEVLSEGRAFVRDVPAFRYLTIGILLIIICETAIEFRFFEILEITLTSAADNQFFYSLYYFVRLALSIVIQLLATTNILNAIGLKNSFFILPISSIVGFLCIVLQPSLWGIMVGTLMEKIPQYTVDESARKAFLGLVPEIKRGRVSSFMDSYLLSIGAIIGSILVGISILMTRQWSVLQSVDISAIIGLTASVLAVASIWKMRSVYDQSMLNWRLKRRQRVKSVLDELDY
ncbi:MAG: hypothetical protein HC924_16805 [Synechococcaceae cyanobacterium SM2_3_2]|nr:hypothetical protein [Synechococcaceae cyanobacterium SM2_3_2]